MKKEEKVDEMYMYGLRSRGIPWYSYLVLLCSLAPKIRLSFDDHLLYPMRRSIYEPSSNLYNASHPSLLDGELDFVLDVPRRRSLAGGPGREDQFHGAADGTVGWW